MIDVIDENLQRGIKLLTHISDAQYSDKSIAPYYSSIGANMRHVLDVFACILKGFDKRKINFSDRERNQLAEEETKFGIAYFNDILRKLHTLKSTDFDLIVAVSDDLGSGVVTTNYTLGGALAQAHSHAIHHFASIGFIIHQLGIDLPDADFGYNPTTPKKVLVE